MNDSRLDVVTRHRSTPGVWFRAFQAALRGRRPPPGFSRYRQGQHFCCWSDRPLSVQMDGDPLPALDWLEIGILPGRLRLITPP